MSGKPLLAALAALVLTNLAAACWADAPKVVLNEADFRDRVYACMLGKNIGGTLGMPFEGAREAHNLTFFTPVPKEPAANDDLDLQLLWLKALEDRGPRINACDLGDHWLRYVPVDWNEYGIGKANMRLGLLPPMSGQFRNVWKDSNGAWIRSEIWACVAPGQPALAARYAFEDACVDHGTAEGTWAELFTASLESAAFVEHDRDRLLAIALSYVPKDSLVAKAVRATMDAKKRGLDWKAAREQVIKVTESTGWFMAPRNVAFTILGWLYGDGEFGKSICIAVNCGDDTDCTGATLGSIWGILYGSKSIPEKWRAPVGEGIKNVAIAGFPAPADLKELTDRTVAMAHRVLAAHGAPVEIRANAPATKKHLPDAALMDAETARELWGRSPWQATRIADAFRATLDLGRDPETKPGVTRQINLHLTNTSDRAVDLAVSAVAPADAMALSPVSARFVLDAGATRRVSLTASIPDEGPDTAKATITVAGAGETVSLPFILARKVGISPRDVALAKLGAKATSDSELERETGCTSRAIDGIIPAPNEFDAARWHSALTQHPHWIAIALPTPKTIEKVVVHFADPAGYPVDFDGEASMDGKAWSTIFTARGNANNRRYEAKIQPTELRHFRLTIRRSASAMYPNAAQVGEIELIEKK